MKTFIIVALIAVLANVNADYPKEKNEEHNKIIAECRKQFKMTDEEFTKLRRGEVIKPDENMQCLVNCAFDKIGTFKDGKYHPEVISKVITGKVGEEKAKTISESCRGESGSTDCETAYKLHKCFLKNEAY